MTTVHKALFEAEWPTVAHQFPGTEPEFGDEEDGYVELLNEQAPAMAYAASCAPPVEVESKPERTAHGWPDFVDNALPTEPSDEISAAPKKKRVRSKKKKAEAKPETKAKAGAKA